MNESDRKMLTGMTHTRIVEPTDPILAKQRSLVATLFDIDTTDMVEIRKMMIEDMKSEDKGVRIPSRRDFMNITNAATQAGMTAAMQQNLVIQEESGSKATAVREQMLSDLRRNLVQVIFNEGAAETRVLATRVLANYEQVAVALLDHHWFNLTDKGWDITKIAAEEVPLSYKKDNKPGRKLGA